MAKRDLPKGFISTGKPGSRTQVINPATGKAFPERTAYNPTTGQAIPRRQLEAFRIRQELGLPASSKVGAFEAKAKARKQQLFKLPRKYTSKRGQVFYRSYTRAQLDNTLKALPPNTIVFVRVRGRNSNPDPHNSPKFYGQRSKRGRLLRLGRYRWITATDGKFLAGDGQSAKIQAQMNSRLTGYYDITALDVVIVGTAIQHTGTVH